MQDQFILSQHPSTRDYVLDVPYATYKVHCEGEHGKLPLAVISFDDRSRNLDADAPRIDEWGVNYQQLGIGPASAALQAKMRGKFLLSQHRATRDYVLDVPFAT